MPPMRTATKSPTRHAQDHRTVAAAGPHGMALAPPTYGLDVVDRAPASDGPLQYMPEPELIRGTVSLSSRGPSLTLVQAPVQHQALATRSNRTGLPARLKAGLESLSGYDMSDVQVHYNSSQPAQLQALAYTQGTDIHVAAGQAQYLPHEAWHVVQQKQGRAKPTLQFMGEQVNDDGGLEKEADVMGEKALLHQAEPSGIPPHHGQARRRIVELNTQSAPLQAKWVWTKTSYGEKREWIPDTTDPFTGEGHRLSDWPFESDEERDAERRAARETAQARFSAGLPPFAEERDITRLMRMPSARTEEEPSSASRMLSFLGDAIHRRRPFTSGATEADVDPISAIESQLIPANPHHALLKSTARERRQFFTGVSFESVELKEAKEAYKKVVEDALQHHRREQPRMVGTLERLWNWITMDIDDSSKKEVKSRHSQLPRIPKLLRAIAETHRKITKNKEEAEKKYVLELMAKITQLHSAINALRTTNYNTLTSDKVWSTDYTSTMSLFDAIQSDPLSQTEENLVALLEQLNTLHQAAQKILGIGALTTSVVQIGLNPFDSGDSDLIYTYYCNTGGIAPKGQVMTVCQKAEKYGGTYTYKGKKYDMYHDSHGPQEGNSDESRTAWKILINGKFQVVGIGHHIPGGAYMATFPYATDPSVQKYGPTPDITDKS